MLLTPTVIWLLVGLFLCLMEMVLPTAFVEFTMGISALIVGLLALVIPSVGIQVAIWIGLSILLTLLVRRFVPRRRSHAIEDSREAETLTAIPPGATGRVLYEGNSWQARCSDERQAIAPHQKVLVVGRQGTTLLVIPDTYLLEKTEE